MRSKVSFKSKFFQSSKTCLSLWVPLAMLATVPVMTPFLINRYQVSVQDLVLPIILNLITATIVTAVFLPFGVKNKLAAYLSATLVILTLTNSYQDRFTAIFPFLKALVPITGLQDLEAPIFNLLFILLIFIIFFFIGRRP